MSYNAVEQSSLIGSVARAADTIKRGTSYTPPRTITLNTKYEGAVKIKVWSGYVIQVVDSKGNRRPVVGPATVLLQYDEYLEPLYLSKGKPKSQDNGVISTAFLRHISNPVSDVIELKTRDLVNVKIQLKYLVRFEQAEKDNWFSVDNYVQYMADHMRSLIGNRVRNISVQEFNDSAADTLRDTVLGPKAEGAGPRPLHHFEENGMTIYDVELIAVEVMDSAVKNLLAESRQRTLTDTVRLEQLKQEQAITGEMEAARREIALEKARTAEQTDEINGTAILRRLALDEAQVEGTAAIERQREESQRALVEISKAVAALKLEIREADEGLEEKIAAAQQLRDIERLVEEAKASKMRAEAIEPALVQALAALAQTGVLRSMGELAPLAIVRGESLAGTLESLLRGTPLESVLENVKALGRVKQIGD